MVSRLSFQCNEPRGIVPHSSYVAVDDEAVRAVEICHTLMVPLLVGMVLERELAVRAADIGQRHAGLQAECQVRLPYSPWEDARSGGEIRARSRWFMNSPG